MVFLGKEETKVKHWVSDCTWNGVAEDAEAGIADGWDSGHDGLGDVFALVGRREVAHAMDQTWKGQNINV